MSKEYKARIARVIDYIEANLNRTVSLNELAEVSHFSAYHFHRIFTVMMDETVNDYVVRRRLECAIHLLIFNTTLSVTQVAMQSGFSSSANFSKAVKLYFGYSPSEIRNPQNSKDSKIGKIHRKYGKAFKPTDLYPSRITNGVINEADLEDINMNIEVRELSGYRVCRLASEQGYELESIYQTWDKLINWAQNNGIKPEQQKRFSFALDNPTVTPIEKCRYYASIVIGQELNVNPPFEVSAIPEGKYAVLYFKGGQDETLKAQMSIYADWLPNSGFEPEDFPMLENYLNDVRRDGFIEMEIYVKLKEM